jgi:hypothetical protein
MNRFVALVLASLLVGCAHTSVGINSSGTAAGGTTSVSAQVTAGASGAAAVALFAIAAVAIHGTSQPAPELDLSRRVNEQDCTKPIKDWSANLKCR